MNLNQITIPSISVEKTADFYKTLGLLLIVEAYPRYARFECPIGGTTFSIHLVEELPKGNGIMIYFEVNDVAEKISEFQKNEITIDEMPEIKRWLWTEASLKDPDGNKIIIYHAGVNRKTPPWRINKE